MKQEIAPQGAYLLLFCAAWRFLFTLLELVDCLHQCFNIQVGVDTYSVLPQKRSTLTVSRSCGSGWDLCFGGRADALSNIIKICKDGGIHIVAASHMDLF